MISFNMHLLGYAASDRAQDLAGSSIYTLLVESLSGGIGRRFEMERYAVRKPCLDSGAWTFALESQRSDASKVDKKRN